MLIGQGLLAHVSFETHRGAVDGQCTSLRQFKAMISGTGIMDQPLPVGKGRYSLTLDPDAYVLPSDADVSISTGSKTPGLALNGVLVMFYHVSESVKEVDFYNPITNQLTDVTPAAEPIICDVTIRRVDPA